MAETKPAESKPSEPSKAVAKTEDKPLEFVPFGGKDPIRLSVSIVKRLIAVKTKNGHNCSDDDAIRFIMMCQARRLNPFEGDAYLLGYDTKDGPKFSLITAHQAFLKRAEPHQEYNGMKSGIIIIRDNKQMDIEGDFHLDTDTIVGGWATVYFKTREHPTHKRLRLSLFNTCQSRWSKDPAGMICKCAEADALRSSFPTMLGGMYIGEEMEREAVAVESKVTPIFKNEVRKSEVTELAASPKSPMDDISALCAAGNITAIELLGFMQEIGMVGEGKDVSDATDSNLAEIIKNWPSVSARIIEARKPDGK